MRAAEETAASLRQLHRPTVSLDAQGVHFQKTLDVSTGGLKADASASASSALSGIAATGVPVCWVCVRMVGGREIVGSRVMGDRKPA